MKWMDLALQKKILNDEPEQDGFNFEIFPLTSMLEFEEVNDQLKPFHARKSLVSIICTENCIEFMCSSLFTFFFLERETCSNWRKKSCKCSEENPKKGSG